MIFNFVTAGESHGPQLTAIIQGVPAGLELLAEKIDKELYRRQQGYGRGARMTIEQDKVEIVSGVRDGYTTGAPITLVIKNKDWENWQEIMTPAKGAKYEKKVTLPRPGHADLAGGLKYRQADLRNILERASARETAARVAVGAVAKSLLASLGIEILSHVTDIGTVSSNVALSKENLALSEQSVVRCSDENSSQQMIAEIDVAKIKGDTLGGIFEVVVFDLPLGLGSHIQWDTRLDGRLAQALMSIPAIKGVEFGDGFATAAKLGSQAHDAIYWQERFIRHTNHAGGVEGGITNGEPLIIRAAMKPIPTLMQPLPSVELFTKEQGVAVTERSDVCAVPAAAIIGEAMVGIILADEVLRKFGGDHIEEVKQALAAYQDYLRQV